MKADRAGAAQRRALGLDAGNAPGLIALARRQQFVALAHPHGQQSLAAILATLNLLAFAIHTVSDIADELWRAAREKLGPRYYFFGRLAAITAYLIFPSRDDLLLTLAFAKPPPLPP